MPYALRIGAGILLSFFWLFQELKTRKLRGLSPSSLKELISLGSFRTSADRKRSGLIFISLAFYFFALWESLIRYMLFIQLGWVSFSVGTLFLLISIYLRNNRAQDKHFSMFRTDYILFFAGSALCYGALISFIFFPWLVWRSYLRLPSTGNNNSHT